MNRALAAYSDAIRQAPKYAAAYAARGDIHLAMEDPKAAAKEYRIALEIAPRGWAKRATVEAQLRKASNTAPDPEK